MIPSVFGPSQCVYLSESLLMVLQLMRQHVLKIRALPQLKPSVEADLGGHLFHVQAFFLVFDDFMDDSHTCRGLPLLVQDSSDQEMENSRIVLDQEIRGSETRMGWNWYFADLGWC